jgi:hypothetical protein
MADGEERLEVDVGWAGRSPVESGWHSHRAGGETHRDTDLRQKYEVYKPYVCLRRTAKSGDGIRAMFRAGIVVLSGMRKG